jgi:hypothetical protein
MALTTRHVASDGTDTYANSTSSSTPMSLTTALANVTTGDFVKVKVGTYTRSASDTLTNAGLVSAPLVFHGCDASWNLLTTSRPNQGALDTSGYPVIAYNSTFNINANNKDYVQWACMRITGTFDGRLMESMGNQVSMYSCSVANASTGSSSTAVRFFTGANPVLGNCDMSAAGSQCALDLRGANNRVIGGRYSCTSGDGIRVVGAVSLLSVFTTFFNSVNGVSHTTSGALATIVNPTAYNLSGRLLLLPNVATPNQMPVIWNGHITDSGGGANNQHSGTTVVPILRVNNRTRDNSNADAGFGDWPEYGAITTDNGAAASDYVNPAGGDLRLIASSVGRRAGLPQYLDCGALQYKDSNFPKRFRVR